MLKLQIKCQYDRHCLHEQTHWTEFDCFSLCRDLDIISLTGRIDWVRTGILMVILNKRILTGAERYFMVFLREAAQHRYASWNGKCTVFSAYSHGRSELWPVMRGVYIS